MLSQLQRTWRCASVSLAVTLTLLPLFSFTLFGALPAHAEGQIINVPGDYPKIQQAIDAAAPGDMIVVQQGTYEENLSITKPLTLSGSNCPLGHGCDDTKIVGNGKRAISITLPISTAQVTILGVVVTNGDATGQGGIVAPNWLDPIDPPLVQMAIPADEPSGFASPQDRLLEFQALGNQLQRLNATHPNPAFGVIQARLDDALALSDLPASAPPSAVSEFRAPVAANVYDCGGGLFSENASLHLVTVDFVDNVASTTGSGAGGGICIGRGSGNLVWENVRFHNNIATTASGALGAGGGAFIWESDLVYSEGRLQGNLASTGGVGWGGAIWMGGDASRTAVLDRIFATAITNTATITSGAQGFGGILYTNNVALTLHDSQFELGTAATGGPGEGGALYINGGNATPIHIYDNLFNDNTAATGSSQPGRGGAIAIHNTVADAVMIMTNSFVANVAAVSGAGSGGALYLDSAPGALVGPNVFAANLAAPNGHLASGGAVAVNVSPNAALTGNRFSGNKGAVGWRRGVSNCAGGAVFVEKSDQFRVARNLFADNACAVLGRSLGGGLALIDSRAPQLIANVFERNTNTLFASDGKSPFAEAMGGGGVGMARVEGGLVFSNSFNANIAGASYLGDPGGGKVYHFYRGGGFFGHTVSELEIRQNVFDDNVGSLLFGGAGGGAAIEDAKSVTFTENLVTANGGGIDGFGGGGGLALINNIDGALVLDNDFRSNQADGVAGSGGGVLAGGLSDDRSVATTQNIVLDSNRFIENRGSPEPHLESYGGAAAFVFVGAITVTNNVFVRNQGGDTGDGLSFWYDDGGTEYAGFFIANNTFYDHFKPIGLLGRPTGAIDIVNTAFISSSVAVGWGKPAPHGTASYLLVDKESDFSAPASITATHILTGPIRFVAPELLDFHLMPNSPTIDAGDPAGVPPAPPVDIEGTPRPYGNAVDIGAYEWHGQGTFMGEVYKD